tara:strand:+ start:114 stop:845 length:732 start_codon:yes stop_codon:yes gene_type:complete
MHYINSPDDDFSFFAKDTLKTIFVHKGNVDVKILSKNGPVDLNIKENQGIILLPNVEFLLFNNNSEFFAVQSEVTEASMVEIIDEEGIRIENNIEEFKLIEKPKKVVKPWGHEIWISWFKNYHVLKRIYMIEGNKCSLQYHEKKSETNFIVSGKANVLKGINLENNISEEDALISYNQTKNINDYIISMEPNDYWDNQAFEIHRVFSIDSYTAYEASTAELDDVIRLQDDNNRASGFIKSEHI